MKHITFNASWNFWPEGKEEQKRLLDLPHDAMLEENRIPNLIEGAATGYFPGGKYFYEKQFHVPEEWQDQVVLMELEGIYQKSEVYCNEKLVGGWIYGYTGFIVDLTKWIVIGAENKIRIVADNSQTPNSRWYSGSGIYRPVSILVGPENHLLPEDICIKTVSIHPAVISINIRNESLLYRNNATRQKFYDSLSDEQIRYKIWKDGQLAAEGKGLYCMIEFPEAKLWDEENPQLYDLQVQLLEQKTESHPRVIDEEWLRFGIRQLTWSSKDGLVVNGQSIKLKGGCIHHDNGILGACEYQDAASRRVKLLKQAGYNAVRSAHNPISKQLLRACDEQGMYILDELSDMWITSKNSYDYSLYFEEEWQKDITAMVLKDRNHPSVIMYSIGNEIPDTGIRYGLNLHKLMIKTLHQLDETRPVTNSINVLNAMAGISDKEKPVHKVSKWDKTDPTREETDDKATGSKLINIVITFMPFLLSLMKPKTILKRLHELMESEDIVGFNYGDRAMVGLKSLNPDYILLNTETFPKSIGRTWPNILATNGYIGDFMWCCWDYLGEVGIGVTDYGKGQKRFNKPFPCISAGIGSYNLAGELEAQGYYTSVVWEAHGKPYIGVHPLEHSGERRYMGQWRGTDVIASWSWNGNEGKKAEFEIYSNHPEVELIVNGTSLGKKKIKEYKAEFTAIYQPGKVEAISYDLTGNPISRSVLITAGKETMLRAVSEKEIYTMEDELCYIPISITDKMGVVKIRDNQKIRVLIEGEATLLGLGTGNPIVQESYLDNTTTTYNGRALAILRFTQKPGKVKVTIQSVSSAMATCLHLHRE